MFIFTQHKADSEGKEDYPKHVYANMEKPCICPILALGVYILSNSYRGDNGTIESRQIFPAKYAETSFRTWLQRVATHWCDDIVDLRNGCAYATNSIK